MSSEFDEYGKLWCTKCGEEEDDDPGDNSYVDRCGGEW